MKKIIIIYLVFLLFTSIIPLSNSYEPFPATVYVDDDYNPTTPGWNITHFDNIEDAFNAVNINGTIVVRGGVYTEHLIIDKKVKLVGDGRDIVIVNGGGSGTIFYVTADEVNITGFHIKNAEKGIDLGSNRNIFTFNDISDNDYGVYFREVNNNTFYYNNFINNFQGMALYEYNTYDNFIYHNNFLNCSAIDDPPEVSTNRWNDSYPSGGNYWSDHLNFTDVKSGPNQNLPGSDGIVDIPYICGRGGIDYYPFMEWCYPPGENTPPTILSPAPSDNETNVDVDYPKVSVVIEDDGTFNWTIQGDYIVNAGANGDTTGIKSAELDTPLPYYTKITWYVNVTDGEFTVRRTFKFTTESALGKTVQEVIDDANPESVIIIPAGFYEENIVIDKPLTLRGANERTTVLDGGGSGYVIEIKSDDVHIEHLTIQNGNQGVYVDDGDEGSIKNCIVKNNVLNGLHIKNSFDFTVSYSNISYNKNGIVMSMCTDNTITHNTVNYNNKNGIKSDSMPTGGHNTYSYNIIDGNGENGLEIYEDNSLILGNTIMNNHINGIVAIGAFPRDPWFVSSVTVAENTIHSNWASGILFMSSEYCIISNNNVSGNDDGGITIVDCYEMEIYENEIYGYNWKYGVPKYQPIGLLIKNSFGVNQDANFIYHNNFFDNQVNAKDETNTGRNIWNDTYPSGGNYWSDFHSDAQGAFDRYRGHYQSIPGIDGIVDANSLNPYNVTGGAGAQDWYPLREPYKKASLVSTAFTWTPRVPRVNETVNFTSLTEGGTIVVWQWDFGDGNKSTGKNTTHRYKKMGYYVVKLRTLNDRGYEDTSVQTLFVAPKGVFIPPQPDPKYPGFTVDEMYMLLRANVLPNSNAEINVFVIDSGVYPGKYKDIDLSSIESLFPSGVFSSGIDENGHGTWVSYAIAVMLKKLPNSHQIMYRIFGSDGESSNEIFIEALEVARQRHVDIVSISAGTVGNPNDMLSMKVAELRREGIFVICAGGNFGPMYSSILSPACSPYAICIAGSDPQWYEDDFERELGIMNLADDSIAEWSSRGPVPNVYPKPDVTSPGESIYGPWVSRNTLIERKVSGTSMATPLISGGTAVVIAQNKDLIELVKTVHFWDKSVVVVAYEEALRESCYVKGSVNDWGAGIVQFDKVSEIYRAKLMGLLIAEVGGFILLIVLIVIAIIVYATYRYKKQRSPWSYFFRKKW